MRRRRWLWIGLGVLVLIGLLPLLAVIGGARPPPLDWNAPIEMPDGRTAPLWEVVADSGGLVPTELLDAPAVAPEDQRPAPEPGALIGELLLRTPDGEELDYSAFVEMIDPVDRDATDLYNLAEWRLLHGDVEQGLALMRSIQPAHPRYARAQRAIGWDLYTRQLGRPDLGIGFVNRSLRADPFDGNAWQDAYRVYWGSLVD